tara:strand:+ start:285 stop:815 length:531 start_codon:yes stop_codon:yes gene_type:complete
MKKLLLTLLCLPLFFSSCTTTYQSTRFNYLSEEDIVNFYYNKNKSDILKDFGRPSKTETFEDIEFWTYLKGFETKKNNSDGGVIFPIAETYIGLGTGSSTSNSSTKYIEFQFKNDLVSSIVYEGEINFLNAYNNNDELKKMAIKKEQELVRDGNNVMFITLGICGVLAIVGILAEE